jgi:hypothetical protein
MCNADLPLARSKERRRTLPSIATTPLNALGEPLHEALEGSTKLCRIEQPEQPAERIVTGHTVFEFEKATQELLFCFREQRHVHRALATVHTPPRHFKSGRLAGGVSAVKPTRGLA